MAEAAIAAEQLQRRLIAPQPLTEIPDGDLGDTGMGTPDSSG
jgi:hypothetical protein